MRSHKKHREAVVEAGEALSELPAVKLTVPGTRSLSHGMKVSGAEVLGGIPELEAGRPVRVFGVDGAFLAVGEVEGGILRPLVVYRPAEPCERRETAVVSNFTG